MTSAFLPPAVMKEIRALLPVWLACTATVAAAIVTNNRDLVQLAMVAYLLGSIALGAQSIGHEYTHRTLGLLMSQPSDRRRLFLNKLAVLLASLVVLNGVASIAMLRHPEMHSSFWGPAAMLLIALGALFVAPCLTMLCRSQLAGVVFTTAIPGASWIAMILLAIAMGGVTSALVLQHRLLEIWWTTMFAVCAGGAIAGWRTFMRLEAIDGRGQDLHLPRWLLWRDDSTSSAAALARARHPVWLLVKKELHLQQMTAFIVGIYILCWATASLLDRFVPDFPVDFPLPITMLYFGLLAILIGSLASAEERQFGTLEWQVLLPMASWKQWAVKVLVANGLALVLGVVVPVALSYVHESADFGAQGGRMWGWPLLLQMTTALVLLTSGALYVSSLCTSGVRALVVMLPVTLAGFSLLSYVSHWTTRVTFEALKRYAAVPFHRSPTPLIRFASDYFWVALTMGFVALMLRLALQNHRSAERSGERIARQAVWIAGYLTMEVLLLAGAETLFVIRFH